MLTSISQISLKAIAPSTKELLLFSQSCLTLCDPWTAAHQASLSFTLSHSLLKRMPSSCDTIQPTHPLSPLLLPSIFPSIRVFSNELVLRIRRPKYWSFNLVSVYWSFNLVSVFPVNVQG